MRVFTRVNSVPTYGLSKTLFFFNIVCLVLDSNSGKTTRLNLHYFLTPVCTLELHNPVRPHRASWKAGA